MLKRLGAFVTKFWLPWRLNLSPSFPANGGLKTLNLVAFQFHSTCLLADMDANALLSPTCFSYLIRP